MRRLVSTFAFAFVLAAATACGDGGDSRTAAVTPGLPRDSALATLGAKVGDPAAGADTLKNIWRRTQYLMAGRNIEILFYSPNNEHWKATDTVPTERVVPVVLIDGRVIGVGRTVYDSVTSLYGIPKNKY